MKNHCVMSMEFDAVVEVLRYKFIQRNTVLSMLRDLFVYIESGGGVEKEKQLKQVTEALSACEKNLEGCTGFAIASLLCLTTPKKIIKTG